MTERRDPLEQLWTHVDAGLAPDQVERSLAALQRKRARRHALRLGAGAAGALAVALTFVLWERAPTRPSSELARSIPVEPAEQRRSASEVAAPQLVALRFRDGSRAIAIDPATEWSVREETEGSIQVELHKGAGRFEVTRGLPRSFRVHAGEVEVAVVGTVFTVRRQEDTVVVAVEEGRVQVSWPGGRRELGPGDAGAFGGAPPPPPPGPAPTRRSPVKRDAVHPPEQWRALAEQGRFEEAFEVLRRLPPSVVRDEADELLLAADAARLAGHPEEALPFLERVVRDHPADPRAALAAFTLGRMLLHQLGRPQEAAAQFARSRALAPGSALALDALAREAEAWARAKKPERARQRALEYLRHDPDGPRAAWVKEYGGLQ